LVEAAASESDPSYFPPPLPHSAATRKLTCASATARPF
jgi:hypothetical protein